MVSNKAYLHFGRNDAELQSARPENGSGCACDSFYKRRHARRHVYQASSVSGTLFASICNGARSQGRQTAYYLLWNPTYRNITCKSTRLLG